MVPSAEGKVKRPAQIDRDDSEAIGTTVPQRGRHCFQKAASELRAAALDNCICNPSPNST